MIKVISFDLQGTLSDSAYSDEFWLDVLPLMYSQKKDVSIEKAKQELYQRFNEYGSYDYRYYSVEFWCNECGVDSKYALSLIRNKAYLYQDTLELVKELSKYRDLIIISSTTKQFIEAELGENKKYFKQVYSSIEDFNIFGKPPELYRKISDILNVSANEIIHIGDSFEMDIKNAERAGLLTFYLDKRKERNQQVEELKYTISKLI